jgi:hypothetical protein
VLINNEIPVSGMVYNDFVDLTVVDLAKPYIDETVYSTYYYISDMTVKHNGVILPEYTIAATEKHMKNSFKWTAKGLYEISMSYRIGEAREFITDTYKFQILPSFTQIEEFNWVVPSGVNIVKIMRNGYVVIGNYTLGAVQRLSFEANNATGLYIIMIEITDGISGMRTKNFQFYIGHRNEATSILMDVGSGQGTVNEVTITYMPYIMKLLHGDISLILYKDGVSSQVIEINDQYISEMEDKNLILTMKATDAGQYIIAAFDAEGGVVFSDSFTIEEAQNSLGTIIFIGVGIVVLIGLIVFLRLRTNMKVK